MKGWDPKKWGDEREQRIILEGIVQSYRALLYFLLAIVLILQAAGLYSLVTLIALGTVTFGMTPMYVHAHRHNVDVNLASLRQHRGRLAGAAKELDFGVAFLFLLIFASIAIASYLRGKPLIQISPTILGEKGEGLGALTGGLFGALIGLTFSLSAWFIVNRKASKNLKSEITAEDEEE